jgi:hypothetical protein
MVAQTIRHLLPDGGIREYDADDLAAIEDVLDAAVEWHTGNLPIFAFWQVGTVYPRPWTYRGETCRGLDCGGYSRFLALNWALNANDPRRTALTLALDAAADAGLISARPEGV